LRAWICGWLTGSYRGPARRRNTPALLPGILVYGYATGAFSSRKLERATHDPVAFRFIADAKCPAGPEAPRDADLGG